MTPFAGDNRLLAIMYDPLAWLPRSVTAQWACNDPAFAPANLRSRLPPWLNQTIIEQHALNCTIDFADDPSAQWWIAHWWRLRRTAYLIGCRILCGALVTSRGFVHLDSCARRFALLPLIAPPPVPALAQLARIDENTLTAQGYLCLMPKVATLPAALRDRIALMFSDTDALRRDSHADAVQHSFPTLISVAIEHAQTDSHHLASSRH